jgi:hypothetical protein
MSAGIYDRKPLKERFEAKYKIVESGCWEWQASFHSGGYGQININKRPIGAHRISYELYKGEITDNLWVLHKCDNRKCVNPDHLFLGTQKDNMQDAKSKGRTKPQSTCPSYNSYARGCRCDGCKKIRKESYKKYSKTILANMKEKYQKKKALKSIKND